MINILLFFIFVIVLLLIIRGLKRRDKKQKIWSTIIVDKPLSEEKKGDDKKINILWKWMSTPEFLLIFGMADLLIAAVLTFGYASFWVFCSYTFGLSFLSYAAGVVLVVAIAGWSVQQQYKMRYSDYFEANFPSALRLISRNLSVGQTIFSAIEAAAENLNDIMQREFIRISQQLKAGNTFEEVLTRGEKLYPYKGYLVFSSYLRVSLKKGGNLKDTLAALAEDLLAAQLIKKKTKALTSESRMSAKILAVLPVVMLGILWCFASANFYYLFTAQNGRYVVIYLVISVTIGFLWINRMIKKVEL